MILALVAWCKAEPKVLHHMLVNGWPGYKNMTENQLSEACELLGLEVSTTVEELK